MDSVVAELRSAERTFHEQSDDQSLERALTLIEAEHGRRPYAAVFRLWLLLLRYDRFGDDRDLDEVIHDGTGWVSVAAALRWTARDGDVTHLDRAIEQGPTARSAGEGFLWEAAEWGVLDVGRAHLERYRLERSENDLAPAESLAREALRTAGEPLVRAACLTLLAACEQEAYLLRGDRPALDRAIDGYERALALVGPGSVQRPMILTELGTTLQDRFTEDEDPQDIARAVALAEEAVRAAPYGPDVACHLVNLGTALSVRHEYDGDPADLDQAISYWRKALDALPAKSPYRPAFLDRLALGHITRAESGDREEGDLDLAIEMGRAAFREGAGGKDVAVYANHLSDALEERWEVRREVDDLHEAVRVLDEVVEEQGARAPTLIANLAHVLLTRFQALGTVADVDAAIDRLRRVDRDGLPPGFRSTIAASMARALSMRYQVFGRDADLRAAIVAARRGVAGVHEHSMPWSSRAMRLAQLVHQRYRREGRRRDLELAIRLMRRVTEVAAEHDMEAAPDERTLLSALLMERHERDGRPADREESIALALAAEEEDHREQAPHLTANVASAVHERFVTDGLFHELDHVTDLHRDAVRAELPTALVYPTLLSNLGLALQDKYAYQDDAVALDEAVDAHERAIAACPAGSPDRPGLMSTLAAAVLLRFQRDDQMTDLDRVIGLYEHALAELGQSAPERTSFLGSLAAARHLRAKATGDRADFDRSVALFRAALRRTRAAQPLRSGLLRGYAEALAERDTLFPGKDRARVLRAFRDAVAASEGAPVLRLEAASAMGAWAISRGRWLVAADAFRLADEARRLLFTAQVSRAHGDIWLKWGEDLNAAEAYARTRLGVPEEAVTALDRGRALRLSAALDGRVVAVRLRADGRPDLADRYERAAERVRRHVRP